MRDSITLTQLHDLFHHMDDRMKLVVKLQGGHIGKRAKLMVFRLLAHAIEVHYTNEYTLTAIWEPKRSVKFRRVISVTQNLSWKSLSNNAPSHCLQSLWQHFPACNVAHKQFQDQGQLPLDCGVNVRYSLRSSFDLYSCRQKSAYTHLQVCGVEHCCASPINKWTSVTTPSGITHPTLQPQLFRFLPTLARFKFPAKDGVSCWQKADAVSSQSHQELGYTPAFFLYSLCHVLGKPLQVDGLKAQVCGLIRLNLQQRQACPGSKPLLPLV